MVTIIKGAKQTHKTTHYKKMLYSINLHSDYMHELLKAK